MTLFLLLLGVAAALKKIFYAVFDDSAAHFQQPGISKLPLNRLLKAVMDICLALLEDQM